MDLELLQTFAAVCEEGSLTRAARRLFRTQPAITQQIHALEREFGQPLLERSARGVRPTPQGKLLQARVGKLSREWNDVLEEMRDLSEGVRGDLRIACSDTVARYFLPPVLERFVRECPRVKLELSNASTPEIARLVEDGDCAVGFALLPLAQTPLELRPVLAYTHVAAYSPGRDVPLPPVALAELQQERLVLLSRGTSTRHYIDEGFQRQGLFPGEVLEVGNVSVQKALVRAGLGVGILPDYAMEPADGLKARAIAGTSVRTIAAITAKEGALSGAARRFLDLLPSVAG